MKVVAAEDILDQLQGAQVVSCFVEDEEGLHVVFQDGRTLVIAGQFVIAIIKAGTEKLH
jgi:hypothetical protein